MALIAPTVDTLGDAALTNSIIDKSIAEIQDELVTDICEHAFYNCTALKKAVFGSVSDVADRAFDGCTALTTVDFHTSTSLGDYAFNNCPALTELILRGATVCHAISGTFQNCGIASGNGYIYVPAALVDAYKAASNWKNYANQIRAIEDYPEVCGTAGKVWFRNTAYTPNGVLTHGVYEEGMLVLSGSSQTVWSEDGKSFTSAALYGGPLFYGDGLWVLCRTKKGFYYSEDGKTWTAGTTTSDGLYSLYWANSLWVAGGNAGIFYSEDGKTWVKSNITTGEYYSFYYANGLWVAGGYNAGVYTSEDGKTWSKISNTGSTIRALCYANGLWVASGGTSYYSEDGTTWTSFSMPSSGTTQNILYVDGLWVAVKKNSNTAGAICYSEDGKTWTACDGATEGYWNLAYERGVWVATGLGMMYSLNGKDWRQSNVTLANGTTSCLAYADGVWVTTGNGVLYYSE